jgi:hypothetical protein
MLLRAVFWIGLVSIVLPREPEPALARAGTASSIGANLASTAAVPDVISTLQTALLRQLAQIKTGIEAQQRARARSE